MAELPDRAELTASPWVLVVGMHRSGTSAIAGALAKLGLQLPVDLIQGSDNPAHNESYAMMEFNDVVLHHAGRGWADSRPVATERLDDAVVEFGEQGIDALNTAFPLATPAVFKDPRLCLLLPFWRQILPHPVGAVFVWRSPMAVARSLAARDRFQIAEGLHLWKHYVSSALSGLDGMTMTFVRYEDAIADPGGFSARAATWLRAEELCSPDQDQIAESAGYLRHDLSHQTDDGELPGSVSELVRELEMRTGVV